MTTYKVRISKKLAEDWKDRGLLDDGFHDAGVHELSEKDCLAYIRHLKYDLEIYRENQWYDFVQATKRQIQAIEKALKKVS
jgi:hypothetical protein